MERENRTKNKKPWLNFAVLLGFLLFAAYSSQVFAASTSVNVDAATSGEEKGFLAAPFVKISTIYESNYYSDPEEEIGVFTYLLQPGLGLSYKTPRSMLEMNYMLNAYFYDEDDDVPVGWRKPSDDDYVGHAFSLNARTRPFAKMTLGMNESYLLTRDSAEYDVLSNITEREKYYTNRLEPYMEYYLTDRFFSRLSYRNTIVSYDTDYPSTEDATENRGIVDLRYQFWPTASLGLEYQYWDRNHDVDSGDYAANQIDFVVRKEAKFLYFEGAVGYQKRDYDAAFRENDDDDTVTFRAAVTGQTSGADEGSRKSWGTLALMNNFTDSGARDNAAETMTVSLDLGHVVMERLTLTANAFYRNTDYSNYSREDDVYGVSAGIGYSLFRWLSFELKAGYEDRDSDLDGYDYDNTYIMLTVGTGMPFTIY